MGFNNNYFKQTNNIFNLKLKPNQFTILSYLIRMANESNSCYPSMNNIVEMCCVSKSTVVKTIEELEKEGYITVNVDNSFNVYIINYDVIETKSNRVEKTKESKRVRRSTKVKEDTSKVDNSKESLEDKLIKETKTDFERVKQAIAYAKSKNPRDLFAYAKETILNNWDIKAVAKNNILQFCDYSQREYDYCELEKQLLGWTEDNDDKERVFSKFGIGSGLGTNERITI